MKSEKRSRKTHFPFNLYENPLKDRHRKFLSDPDYKGKNLPQTADELEDKMEQSFRLVFHTLLNFQKLERKKVYEIVNAKSMHHLLDAAVGYYDFRTSELVRLLFEISIIFLKQSPQLENQKEDIEEKTKSLSRLFQTLSETLLQEEDLNKNISKEEREKIKLYLKRSDSKSDFKLYKMLKKDTEELYNELIKQDLYTRIISKKVHVTDPFDPILPTIRHSDKEIIERIRKNENEIARLHGESAIREGQIWRLSNAYNHLEPYACRLNPLKEFEYLLSRTLVEDSYILDLDKELNEHKLLEEFDDIMCEKYKNKKLHKDAPGIHLRYSSAKWWALVPTNEYNKQKREFFQKHGIELDKNFHSQEKKHTGKFFEIAKYKPKWSFDSASAIM